MTLKLIINLLHFIQFGVGLTGCHELTVRSLFNNNTAINDANQIRILYGCQSMCYGYACSSRTCPIQCGLHNILALVVESRRRFIQ